MKPWMIAAAVVIFALGFACGYSFAHSPASELSTVAKDAATLPAHVAPFVRYVTQYNADPNTYATGRAALSLILNSVSRTSRIALPTPIAGGRIQRVNLAAYGIDPALWESLISQEPYFHARGSVLGKDGKPQAVYSDAGWCDLAEQATLKKLTSSTGAICRLDWLVAKLAVPPFYYDFAGIPKTEAELKKSLGIDDKTIVHLRASKGENILHSGVTAKVRRVSRKQGPLGGYWATYDTEGTDPEKDFVRNPTFYAKFDASEVIFFRANGTLGYFITDGKGDRQDVVPDKIARDHSDTHGDQRLVPGKSCISCHATDGGLRAIATDQSDLLKSGADILLPNPADADALGSFYDAAKLNKLLARDTDDYADAVKSATGLNAKAAATALMTVYDGYEWATIGHATAEAELGSEGVLDALKRSTDGVLVAVALGKRISRKQWELSFQEAALLTKGKP